MTLFLLVTSALALDSQSLRSTTTSDLFRDPYDFFDQPGLLSFEEENAVLTNLSAYGSSGRYMLGYYGGGESGVFGAAIDFGASSSGSDSKGVFDIDDNDNDLQYDITTVSTSTDKTKAWTAVLSYGLRASDTMGLGAALRIGQIGESGTYAGSIGSTLTDVDCSDEDDCGADSALSGTGSATDRTISIIAGGAVNGATSTIAVHAVVNTVLARAKGNSSYVSGDFEDSLFGYIPGTSFADNRKGIAPGLGFEGVFDLSDTMALRIDADGLFGFGGPAVEETVSISVDDGENGSTTTNTTSYTSGSWKANSFGALVALQIEGESIKVRPGVRIRSGSYNERYTLESVSEYEPDEGESTDSTSESESASGVSALTVGLPIAVEVSLDPDQIWTLRMGADWSWTKATIEQGPLTNEDEDAGTTDTQTSSSSSAATALLGTFGLRFWPVDAFRLDATAQSGSGFTPDDGESGVTALASVWLSATLVIP